MKEYATGELARLMRQVGFRKLRTYVGGRGKFVKTVLAPVLACEAGLKVLPRVLRKRLARTLPVRALLGVRLVAVK